MSEITSFSLQPVENERLYSVCGQLNCHIKQIEDHLQVKISRRSHHFNISGEPEYVNKAAKVIQGLYALTENKEAPLMVADIHLALATHDAEICSQSDKGFCEDDEVIIKFRRNVIRGRNIRQKDYLRSIRENVISFGIGPAGTGKTYLAIASAVSALAENEIERIILVRPAVEAGEKLGFLPGDIGQKIDPYLRPLFDALYEMLGFDRVGKLISRGTIELAPLAYMRGRTLNESFVVLDEAQNATKEQMKMFLTRIGFGSKAIITGDITQVDLPKGQQSGLRHARDVLSDVHGIHFTHFKPKDVVRHPLVQRIVEAYERIE